MKQMTVEEIIEKNPKIDEKKLKESMDLSDKLRSHGISARGYSLVLPFAGKKVQAVDSKEDKRTINLTRS